jgi:hypothetical protein
VAPQSSDPEGDPARPDSLKEEELVREVIRLSRNVLGLTLGILFAGGMFLATNILILKGGARIGPHLQLLNQFFPGYRVSFAGSLIGAVYGFGVGYFGGWIIAAVYNQVALFRRR